MARSLNDFHGDSLLVGGEWLNIENASKPQEIFNPNNFYAINIDNESMPDACIDITDEKQCAIFPDKYFSFVYFEGIPFDEEKQNKSFLIAQRILKDDGILIYRGASDKFGASVPEVLKNAGFKYAIMKEFPEGVPHAETDNGSLSLASNTDLNLIQKNLSKLCKTAQYYINHYQFFSDIPFVLGKPYEAANQKPSDKSLLKFLQATTGYKIKIKTLSLEAQEKLAKAGFSEEDSIDKDLLVQERVISKILPIESGFILTPLTYAVKTNDFNLVKSLVEAGASIDKKDSSYFFTPLMWASWYGHNDIVKYLLENGADATLESRYQPSQLTAAPIPNANNHVTAIDLTKYSYFSPAGFWYSAKKYLSNNVDIEKTKNILEEHLTTSKPFNGR